MVHRPAESSDDLYAERALRIAELEHQAALIARHVARLRERPLFARDDISEQQADELETRLRNVRQSTAAIQAARRTP